MNQIQSIIKIMHYYFMILLRLNVTNLLSQFIRFILEQIIRGRQQVEKGRKTRCQTSIH
jgi:hypothetical protein